VTTYVAGTERLPGAVLFRMRTGSPYREATLAHDFACMRDLAFPAIRQIDGYAQVPCGRGEERHPARDPRM
jgi:hypothetical protein